MEKITIANVEKEIQQLLSHKEMSCASLEKYVLLERAKKYLSHGEKEFAEAEAKAWVEGMHPPARWTMEQTSAVMKQKGYGYKPCVFWAVMNSLVTDYGKYFAKIGMDKTDVWAEMAHAWLSDDDAVSDKAAQYYWHVVNHLS